MTRRLPTFVPEDLDEAQNLIYEEIRDARWSATGERTSIDERGALGGPFNAMLLHPAIGGALHRFGAAVRYESFPPRLSETVILEVARLHRSEYEWYAHHRAAAAVGLSEEQIAAILAGDPVPGASEEEILIRDATHDLVTSRDLDDDRYQALVRTFGEPGVVALVGLVGYYEVIATMLGAFRVGLPQGAVPAFGAPEA